MSTFDDQFYDCSTLPNHPTPGLAELIANADAAVTEIRAVVADAKLITAAAVRIVGWFEAEGMFEMKNAARIKAAVKGSKRE